MTAHSLSPGFVVLHYAATFGSELHTHKAIYPVQPTPGYEVGTEPSFVRKSGDPDLMSTLVDEYVTLLLEIFNATTTFTHAEFWAVETPTSDPLYVFTHTLGDVGNNTNPNIEAAQLTVSFRSTEGGIFRLTCMESAFTTGTLDLFPFSNADLADLADYMYSNQAWIIARDGGKLAIPFKAVGKQNDALRRKYILTT